MSFFRPHPQWPAILAPFWPWIWVQVLMLRAYIRRTYGAGTPFQWSLDRHGRVILLQVIPKGSEQKWVAKINPHDRIAAALDGRLFTPAYAQDSLICAHPGAGRGPVAAGTGLAALDPGLRRDERVWRNLPLPET